MGRWNMEVLASWILFDDEDDDDNLQSVDVSIIQQHAQEHFELLHKNNNKMDRQQSQQVYKMGNETSHFAQTRQAGKWALLLWLEG